MASRSPDSSRTAKHLIDDAASGEDAAGRFGGRPNRAGTGCGDIGLIGPSWTGPH
jgi:hypothetical protein